MGSATTLPTPKTKTIFIEDLPPEEAAKVSAEPSGLMNLGNTCYLNSVVQCLRRVEPLRDSLKLYNGGNNASAMVLKAMDDTFNNLDRNFLR